MVDDIRFMLARKEAGAQYLQRRCFIVSSFRNREVVAEAVTQLRARSLFVYDFTASELSDSESDWNPPSLERARQHVGIGAAARADLAMLKCLGAADIVLVILPAGFAAGWEAGYAAGRGAQIVVCSNGSEQVDVPLLHAHQVFASLHDSIEYLSALVSQARRMQ
jgi:hypothetical protein